ncbi:branched-chain amino acid ABC transporter permease [Phytohabitans flavus]|uniref:Branched-chain amino acid ABC transporter permease n=1 Tax=Phytohabitans flavus TaxID=1076124 RepID=A0A6F8XNF4_9ACTN|nr:branched-chain amino acid ABC transporter permease [Phytohabitans flavus]BCB75329.1 branched-chain amino acid ABC transporter permease [Phytohabitans flavus]
MIQAVVNGIADGMLIGLMALGITLIYAVQKFPNVSHGALVTGGAYLTYLSQALTQRWYLAVALGLVLSVALGMAAYQVVIRPFIAAPLMTLMIVTIGLEFVLDYTIALVWGNSLRTYDFGLTGQTTVGGFYTTHAALATSAVALLAMAGTAVVLTRSRLGRDMRALSDDPSLAQVARVSRQRTLLFTWGLVGLLAGLAGVSYGVKAQLTPMLGWHLLLPSFAAAILGGLGSFTGAILGGVLIGVGMEVFSLLLPTVYKPAMAFVVLTVLLLARPRGLFGKAVRV